VNCCQGLDASGRILDALTQSASRRDMLEHVRDAIGLLREYYPERAWALKLILEKENTARSRLEEWHERQLVHFVQILVSSTGDLYRAHVEKMISTLAWLSRNLLELSIWIEFCTASDSNARRFEEDAMRDMYGWAQAIHGMYKDAHDREHQDLGSTMEDLKKFAISKGVPTLADDYKRVRDAANELGRDDEYEKFFKLYSKFAHPTAWVVKSASSIDADEDLRDMFFTDGVDRAVLAINRIRERVLTAFPELQKEEAKG